VTNKGGHVKKALAVTVLLGTSLFLAYAVAQQAADPLPTETEHAPDAVEQNCGQEAHWDPKIQRCRRNVPLKPSQTKLLPPPAGVIVLRPGGKREEAEICPIEFEEKTVQGWRFCVDPENPEEIPLLMVPPVEGIPYDTVQQIVKRRGAELRNLPGVDNVILGPEGIIVETDNPAAVPQSIEGVPIKTVPRQKRKFQSHSQNFTFNPIDGSVVISDSNGRCCTNRQDRKHLLKQAYEEKDTIPGAQLGSV
jgi:hypothetical protein